MMNEGKVLWFLDKVFYEPLLKEYNTLSTKVNNLLCRDESLDPANFSIAGGAIRCLFTGEKIKDIDVFCASKEAEESLIKFLTRDYEVMNVNNRLANFKMNDRWIQVIRGKYYKFGGSKELIDSFDFSICQAMVWYNHLALKNADEVKSTNLTLEVNEFFFEDCLTKHLRVNKITFPLNSLERMQKYIKNGYTACRGTILEIYKSIKSDNVDRNLLNSMTFYGLD